MEDTTLGQCVLRHFEVDLGQRLRVGLVRHFRRMHALYLHHCHSLREDAQLFGGTIGEVDDASATMRTAVGDAHYHLLAVALVGDTKEGAEGMGAVSTRKTVVVKTLATACARAGDTL